MCKCGISCKILAALNVGSNGVYGILHCVYRGFGMYVVALLILYMCLNCLHLGLFKDYEVSQ